KRNAAGNRPRLEFATGSLMVCQRHGHMGFHIPQIWDLALARVDTSSLLPPASGARSPDPHLFTLCPATSPAVWLVEYWDKSWSVGTMGIFGRTVGGKNASMIFSILAEARVPFLNEKRTH